MESATRQVETGSEFPVSLYWYDYETFGVDPARDRPAQFAGVRTDDALNLVAEPTVLFCKPADDFLPHPDACLVTGITPQIARNRGLRECEFIAAIAREFSRPNTCVVGYNNIRFDDEVTRYCLYRNLRDPYEREWRHGNSRWDIIDLVRLTRALRPAGLHWPHDDGGRPSFRLERLSEANGIAHTAAHDALSDVYATIGMAKLIRSRQRRLYDFVFAHRGKREAAELLQCGTWRPVVHVSEKFPTERGCLAVVVALARHPRNPNGIIVFDLAEEPSSLIDLSAEEIRQRVFIPVRELPAGVRRVALKTVHLNKCPVLAPLKVLREEDQSRWSLDLGACFRHLEQLQRAEGLAEKLAAVFGHSVEESGDDPDLGLYRGGFLSAADRDRLARLTRLPPESLGSAHIDFADPRLPEMVFRYRARNYPETLNEEERARWNAFRLRRLTIPGAGGSLVLADYERRLCELEAASSGDPRDAAILAELRAYGREITGQRRSDLPYNQQVLFPSHSESEES